MVKTGYKSKEEPVVWGLTIYVFYIGDEIVFVGDREILMSFHDSFLSVVLIQLLI